jgi:hypothetical protein
MYQLISLYDNKYKNEIDPDLLWHIVRNLHRKREDKWEEILKKELEK